MAKKGLSRDLALRIGLAANALPEVEAATLITQLSSLLELPITSHKLESLTSSQLAEALKRASISFKQEDLALALRFLQGEEHVVPAFPQAEPYQDGEFEHSIRVAMASNGEAFLDGHFASCKAFLIYQVSENQCRLIDVRYTHEAKASDDKTGSLTALIDDCHLLYVISIGGPAAARVIRQGLHPVKLKKPTSVALELKDLQKVLAADTPPWLAKIMGRSAEDRARINMESL